MKFPRVRFMVRRMMIAAGVAIFLVLVVAYVRSLHVHDVRISIGGITIRAF